MKLIRLILDQTNKNLWFTKTSSSSCRGVGAAKSTSPSWSSTCRNRQQDQARLPVPPWFSWVLWYLCETKYREQLYANSPGCWMRCPFLEGFPSNHDSGVALFLSWIKEIINLWSLQLASGVFLFVCFVFGKEVSFFPHLLGWHQRSPK